MEKAASSGAKGIAQKDTVAKYLQEKYGEEVEINNRPSTTKPGKGKTVGLPLADTHYTLKNGQRKCFVYVYDVDGNSLLIVKVPQEYGESLKKNHNLVSKSAFPKTRDASSWYSVPVDETWNEARLCKLLDDAKMLVEDPNAKVGDEPELGLSLKESMKVAAFKGIKGGAQKDNVSNYLKEKYGDERRTEIEYNSKNFRIEDMIANEQVVITISHHGYIKRTSLSEYKTQNRGGKGSKGSATREEDFIEHVYIASMHDYMLLFTNKGRVHWMRVYEIPEGTKTSKGRAIQNLLSIEEGEVIRAFINTQDLKDEDYQNFYRELYPMAEDPLFNIHLNVDYPFNLTGILYFPKIRNNFEVQKNKIQLYCNQVYVTDSVEGIVPDFLTLLHGVLDSPDIPLNVSRSYLQSDRNVKQISNHITKKVADRLQEIFKNTRDEYEKKWDDLKLFITYGMLSEEKFYDRAKDFALFKNVDGKFFTYEEYKTLIKDNQTDKNGTLIYLYANNPEEQYSYIQKAKNKGYDVLLMDGHLDSHLISQLEQKFEKVSFTRVDADIIENLVKKEDLQESKMTKEEKDDLSVVFSSQASSNFMVQFENLPAEEAPIIVTQSEYMRRMKDMAQMNPGMSFYNQIPDNFNLIVNANHPLIAKINADKYAATKDELDKINSDLKPLKDERQKLEDAKKDKKEEEIPVADKEKLESVNKQITELEDKKKNTLSDYGKSNKTVKQLIDLALISNNMLKGEALEEFVKRSVSLL